MKWALAGMLVWVMGCIALIWLGVDDSVGLAISLGLIVGVPLYVIWDMLTG